VGNHRGGDRPGDCRDRIDPAMSRLRHLLRNLFQKKRVEEEHDDEVRSYLEMSAAEKMARGMSADEAQRAARLEAGGVEQVKEAVRDVRAGAWFEQLHQDVRYGLRALRRRPGSTAIAVLAVGLGVGSATAIWSVADAVLIRSLPVRDLDRTVMVWQQDLTTDRDRITFSPAEYLDYRDAGRSFESLGALQPGSAIVRLGDTPTALETARVTRSLFDTLDIKAALGRAFVPDEERPGRDHVVMLTNGFWQRQFGSDRHVLGTMISLQGDSASGADATALADGPYTIVGVLPPQLPVFYSQADVWIPLPLDRSQLSRTVRGLRVFARLRPGVLLERASADCNAIARDLTARYPETNRDIHAWLVPLRSEDIGDIQPSILTLLAAVALLLAIVCANVANLLLTRAVEREREISVRLALGASRRRLIRQLLTESLLLGLSGGGVGLLFAASATHVVRVLGPATISRVREVALNGPGFAAALAISLLTSLLFGLAPALKASRSDVTEALKQRSGPAKGGERLRQILVTVEIALAFVVLAGTAAVIKSYLRLDSHLGYEPSHLLTARIGLPRAKYSDPGKREAFFRAVLEQLRSTPGVVAAGAVNILPQADTNQSVSFTIAGRPTAEGQARNARLRVASPGYFRSLGASILRGREFEERDLPGGAVIVSRAAAQRFWPGENPLGQQVELTLSTRRTPMLPIVGVVEDVRQWNVSAGEPTLYWSSMIQPSYSLAVRTAGDPADLAPLLLDSVRRVDPDQPVSAVATMAARLARSQGTTFGRFRSAVMTWFGLAALLLSIMGISGVIHYSMVQRTQEFGVRTALGARAGDVIRIVLTQALRLVLVGSAIGLLGSLALTRVLARYLYGVERVEPWIAGGILVSLGTVALTAALVPAAKAARINPIVALRHE